jgi:dihydrofolate reductase
VDRYHLLVFPLILGSGKRLFAEAGDFAKLELCEQESYDNGIIKAIYDVVR